MRRFVNLPEKEQTELTTLFNSLPDEIQAYFTVSTLDDLTRYIPDPQDMVKAISAEFKVKTTIFDLIKMCADTGQCVHMFESGASVKVTFTKYTSANKPARGYVGRIDIYLQVGDSTIHAAYDGPSINISWINWIVEQIVRNKTIHIDAVVEPKSLQNTFNEGTFQDAIEHAINTNLPIETITALT